MIISIVVSFLVTADHSDNKLEPKILFWKIPHFLECEILSTFFFFLISLNSVISVDLIGKTSIFNLLHTWQIVLVSSDLIHHMHHINHVIFHIKIRNTKIGFKMTIVGANLCNHQKELLSFRLRKEHLEHTPASSQFTS